MRIGHHAGAAGIAAASLVLLTACGGRSLSGTYVDPNGNLSLTFGSGGKVRYHANETGFSEDASYRVSGSNLTIATAKGALGKLTIESNGCLHSPTMGELCKPRKGS